MFTVPYFTINRARYAFSYGAFGVGALKPKVRQDLCRIVRASAAQPRPVDLVLLGLALNKLRFQSTGVSERPYAWLAVFIPRGGNFWLACSHLLWSTCFLSSGGSLALPGDFLRRVFVRLAFGSRLVHTTVGSSVRVRRGGYGLILPGGVSLVSDTRLVNASRVARYFGSDFSSRSRYFRLVLTPRRRQRLIRTGRSIRTYLVPGRDGMTQTLRCLPSRWFRLRKFIQRRKRAKFFYFRKIRGKRRGFGRIFPNGVVRRYRFVRKFRALFTVRAQHTNLFFTIRQGNMYFLASTGMFEDLKHGTKRKRTLLAGWFLADRLFERAQDFLKEKTIFQVDLYGRTSGRRGVWFSWRTKPWRLFSVRSRTPIAYNGTRGCRRRRL